MIPPIADVEEVGSMGHSVIPPEMESIENQITLTKPSKVPVKTLLMMIRLNLEDSSFMKISLEKTVLF